MARESLGAAASASNDLVRVADVPELAQDAVGTILVDSSRIDFTYNDATPSISADVIDNSVSFAKFQQIASDRLLGRDTASTGNVEELTVSGGVEFTGSGGIRTSAFTGDVTKSAGGTAQTIANDAVTYAKMQNVSATSRFLGRITAAAGDVEELTAANAKTILAYAASDVAFTPTGTIAATNVQAAIAEILTDIPPRARVFNSTNQTLTTGVNAVIDWNSEDYDTDTMHSTVTNNSRITATTAGLYLFIGQAAFASNATGYRLLFLQTNGTTLYQSRVQATSGGVASIVQIAGIVTLNATDYVEMFAGQGSGGNLDVVAGNANSFLQAHRLSPV